MKLGDLVVARKSLERLLVLDLPAAMSYKIARAVRPVQAELQNYERERVKLVQRLGGDDGQGQIMVLPEKVAEFNEELSALLDVDVKLEIETVNPDILNEDGVKVKPADLMALLFLFEEKE